MGRIGEIVSTERDAAGVLTVRVDPGGGGVVTAEHFAPAGDDSRPLPGDFAALEESAGAGAEQAVGYSDAIPNTSEEGEVHKYSRSTDGVLVAELWLRRDGTAELLTLNGAPLRLKSTGPIIVDSPDVRLSDSAGAQVARVGDIAVGVLNATSTAPGQPIAPGVPGPVGVPIAVQIISGSSKVKSG